MKRHAFNMIEILLALGVIAIGVVSVLALFPAGLKSTRDAMAETYAASSAEQLLHSVRWTVEGDWDTWTDDVAWYSRPNQGSLVLDVPVTNDNAFFSGGAIQEIVEHRVYKLVAFTDDPPANQAFDPGEKVDFQCLAAVWGELIPLDSTTNVLKSVGVRVNVEVSWPGQLPYAARSKRVYSLEVFNVKN